jgi:uncharacterized protein (DUF433 family)
LLPERPVKRAFIQSQQHRVGTQYNASRTAASLCFPARARLPPILSKGYDVRGRIMPTLDWSQCPVVESIPGKVSGAWVLKGTRMPVSAIFENLEAGANIDDIMEWFDGLDREQVKAVIEFAARSLDKAPEYAP